MSLPYLIVTIAPLCIFLIATTVYEYQTGLIPDKATIPAGFYFVVTSSLLGPPPWWQYPVASALGLAILLGLALGYAWWTGRQALGGGAIKLLSVVAGAVGIVPAARLIAVFFLLLFISGIFVRVFSALRAVPSSPLVFLSALTIFGQAAWRDAIDEVFLASIDFLEPIPLTLIVVIVVALVLDMVNGYIRICVRQSAAHGVAHLKIPGNYLSRFIDLDLPEIFRPPWVVPSVFGAWLIVGLALLIYGIILYGILIGLSIRLVVWCIGRFFARAFASLVNSSLRRLDRG